MTIKTAETPRRLWRDDQVAAIIASGGALALDERDGLHVSYQAGDQLYYAHWQDQTWQSLPIESGSDVVGHSALALRRQAPLIGFVTTNGDVKLASLENGTWSVETVAHDDSGLPPGMVAMVVDGNGRVHLTFWRNGRLHYGYRIPNRWIIETVDDSGLNGFRHSLAVDRQFWPRVAYHHAERRALCYAWRDSQGWHIENVAAPITDDDVMGQYPSLALAADGTPHISYDDGGALKLARRQRQKWSVELVDNSSEDGGLHSQLAIAAAGRPHVTFYDAANGAIRYAVKRGGTWEADTIATPDAAMNWPAALVLNNAGAPYLLYVAWADERLRFVRAYRAPEAGDDAFTTGINKVLRGNLLHNDSGPDAAFQVVTEPIVGPGNGRLTIKVDGSFTYRPAKDFSGTDQFTYQICDENGLCDTAQVVIQVSIPVRKFTDKQLERWGKPEASTGGIRLELENFRSGLYLSVQWQDGDKNWHDIGGWQGRLDRPKSDTWWVGQAQMGGTYRWVIGQQTKTGGKGSPLIYSESFKLPAPDVFRGQTLVMMLRL